MPYFNCGFIFGFRPGEQIALKPEDIDWQNKTLKVLRAITLDKDGKRTEGNTKNKFSRRTIELTPLMLEALEEQRKIHEQYHCEYFFCTPTGSPVHLSNLMRFWQKSPPKTKRG
jgi:integrase